CDRVDREPAPAGHDPGCVPHGRHDGGLVRGARARDRETRAHAARSRDADPRRVRRSERARAIRACAVTAGRGDHPRHTARRRSTSSPTSVHDAADDDRLAELARGAPAALLLYAEDGALLAQNEAAREAFGATSLSELLGSPERAADLVATVRQ